MIKILNIFHLIGVHNDPISGSRFFQQADDLTAPGSGIRVEAGHHRLEVIRQRVKSGQISPDTLIEVLKQ